MYAYGFSMKSRGKREKKERKRKKERNAAQIEEGAKKCEKKRYIID